MDGEPTSPAGRRRARVALPVAGVAVLLAATAGIGVTLGSAGQRPGLYRSARRGCAPNDAVMDSRLDSPF